MDLVFVWVADIDLISVCGIELDLISARDRMWFVLCLGVENDLVLVSGSELTSILCDDVRLQINMESWQMCWFCSGIPLGQGWLRFIFYKRKKEILV